MSRTEIISIIDIVGSRSTLDPTYISPRHEFGMASDVENSNLRRGEVRGKAQEAGKGALTRWTSGKRIVSDFVLVIPSDQRQERS